MQTICYLIDDELIERAPFATHGKPQEIIETPVVPSMANIVRAVADCDAVPSIRTRRWRLWISSPTVYGDYAAIYRPEH